MQITHVEVRKMNETRYSIFEIDYLAELIHSAYHSDRSDFNKMIYYIHREIITIYIFFSWCRAIFAQIKVEIIQND